MQVQHGTLFQVYGNPVRHEAWTFMPADVSLDGSAFSLDYRLSDHLPDPVPHVLRTVIRERIDAAWVRARIPRVFGFTPDPAEIEKSLIATGFTAVVADHTTCYPFLCIDTYGHCCLMFSDEGPDASIKQSIAATFWNLLLQNPNELDDFEQRVYHPGASIWLTYGCASGQIYCDESQD